MDDIKKFLPTGPNFAVFDSAASTIAFVAGVLLGLAAIVALVAFFVNLFKLAGAAIGGNSVTLGKHGKNTGIALLLLFVFVGIWGVVVTIITRLGSGIG